MVRVLTLNLWGYNSPYDYTVRRGITRGAVAGSPAATREAPGGSAWPLRRRLILDLLQAERPDVAGFQEVAAGPSVEHGRTAAAQLGDALGRHVLYAEGDGEIQRAGLTLGLAILSPHPCRELARIPLPDRDGAETYLCLAAEVLTPEGRLVFLTTHFALGGETEAERAHQHESVRRILAYCRSLPARVPVVLCGDLNSAPELKAVRCLRGEASIDGERGAFQDAGVVATGGFINTMASHDPNVPLDYILVANAAVLDCRAVGAPNADGYYPSDHLGLVADLRLEGGRNRPVE